jgi:hypothetical protein
MRIRVLSVLTAVGLATSAYAAEPKVTEPHSPSPADAASKRWLAASFEASFLEYIPDTGIGSQAARMLATVRRGDPLRSGIGWYDPGQNRYNWSWFAERYDGDSDKRITKRELDGVLFDRLDRDRDGSVTEDDFDWSDRSDWAKQTGVSLRLFRSIDRDGSGKVSEQEMLGFFRKLSNEKGHVTPDDLRNAMLQAAAIESGKGKSKAKKGSDEVWMKGLFASDLGSPFDGPSVEAIAPDFTLTTQDGKEKMTLSAFRDKRPVVLIFGSFT